MKRVAWNKGLTFPKKDPFILKVCHFCNKEFQISRLKKSAKYCSHNCYGQSLVGISNHWLGKKRTHNTGSYNPNWRGGVTKIQDQVRTCLEMKQWKRKILVRDNFHCVIGGKEHGNKLAVDHIKQFALILQENKITTIEEALKCSQLWDINNGRTLCVPCHKQTDTYLKKLIIVT